MNYSKKDITNLQMTVGKDKYGDGEVEDNLLVNDDILKRKETLTIAY